jgi:hypothetical protein
MSAEPSPTEEPDRAKDLDVRLTDAVLRLVEQMTDGEDVKTRAFLYEMLADVLYDRARALWGGGLPRPPA